MSVIYVVNKWPVKEIKTPRVMEETSKRETENYENNKVTIRFFRHRI